MVNLVPFHFLLNRMECSERWKRTKWERSVLPFHFTSLHYLLFTLVFCSPFITPFFQEMRKWIMVRFFPFFSFQFTLPFMLHSIVIEMNERRETKRTKRKKKDKVKMIRFLKTKNNLKLLIRIQFWEDSMGWKRETQEMKIRTTHEIGLWMSVSHWKVKEKYALKIRLKV